LHWFDKFNRDRTYPDRVKAFNFMLAYQVSPTALNRAIALGVISNEFIDDGLPAVVAPYGDDPEKTVANCFDRHTGKQIPPEILATYLEAVAGYHRHSESKFANGEGDNVGITKRRHIQAIVVEYIGKEANRWEEQFYLGEIPEAQIVYGLSAEGKKQVLRVIDRAARKFGPGALATTAALSRQQLSEVLKRKANPRPRTLSALLHAVATLETERHERRTYEAALIERGCIEVSQTSLSETAERLSADPSNLAKVLSAQRRPSDQLLQRMETLFRAV
jgi:DNA-binding phage protein